MLAGLRKYRTPLLLLVTFVLVVLTGYLASSWHQHDPYSRNACPFSGFERAGMAEPAAAVILLPPAGFRLADTRADRVQEAAPALPEHATRAPPSCSLSQAL